MSIWRLLPEIYLNLWAFLSYNRKSYIGMTQKYISVGTQQHVGSVWKWIEWEKVWKGKIDPKRKRVSQWQQHLNILPNTIKAVKTAMRWGKWWWHWCLLQLLGKVIGSSVWKILGLYNVKCALWIDKRSCIGWKIELWWWMTTLTSTAHAHASMTFTVSTSKNAETEDGSIQEKSKAES